MKSIEEIISNLKPIAFSGNSKIIVTEVCAFNQHSQKSDALTWCNEKKISELSNIVGGTVICPKLPNEFLKNNSVNYIEVEKPRMYFTSVLRFLYPVEFSTAIASSAKISANVKMGKNISIGQNVVIEENCSIGENCRIGHNTVIYSGTTIGNNVVIGSNCTISGTGFGYEKNDEGNYEMIPHIGNVVLEDFVEIGNNVCIDRAVLSSTVLKKNVKVDNLVHIAHNVTIDENSLIIANSMIGGSTFIGKNSWIAPSVSIMNKIHIGDHVTAGMGAVILKSVENNQIVVGNPAKPIDKK